MWFEGRFIKIKRIDNPDCIIGNKNAVLVIEEQSDKVAEYLGVYGKTGSNGFRFQVEGCPEIQVSTVFLRGRLKNWDGSPLIVAKEKLDELRVAFVDLDTKVARSLSKDGEVVVIDGLKYRLSLID